MNSDLPGKHNFSIYPGVYSKLGKYDINIDLNYLGPCQLAPDQFCLRYFASNQSGLD